MSGTSGLLRIALPSDGEGGTRPIIGSWYGNLYLAAAISVSLYHIWANVISGTLSTLQLAGYHFAGFVFLCALRYPMIPRFAKSRVMLAIDIFLGALVAGGVAWLINQESAIYDRGVRLSTWDWIFAVLTILAAIDLTRRTTGLIIPLLIIIALSYVSFWGSEIEGIFKFAGTLTMETITFRSIFGDEGMFGIIGRISATFVFMFILFGAFLVRSGAGDFIIDLARALAGRVTGGPGFVAVFSSGLTGTISGSAVANTVSTGVITIPLMQRSGFPSRFAAGVEAASSTGGQLMPPIMGAGAFVMASYTQIPYLDIVAVAFLPALAYFLSVAIFVRIEAKRSKVRPPAGDSPRALEVLRRGGPAFLIPIAVLVALLIYGMTPVFAAGFAILAVIVASWLTPNRMGPRAILEALILGAHNMVMTGVLLIAVGLIVNVIAMTGIGNTFSLMIAEWSDGNLLIAIALIALASLVLGMGLPVTAAYIVLATLSAPALQSLIVNFIVDIDGDLVQAMAAGTLAAEIRPFFMLADPEALTKLAAPMPLAEAQALFDAVPGPLMDQIRQTATDALPVELTLGALLSAHMIIFWLSQDSNVTPPVCLTAFAAAAIAKTKPMATGFTSWKLAKGLYLMPILFAYTPFLTGTTGEVLLIFVIAVLGLCALGAAIEGYFEGPLAWPFRLLLAAGGVALIWPNEPLLSLGGAALVLAILAWNVLQDQRAQAIETK
ncbi:MAG: TRAP transporter fused permease subunit [Pseudomonadota bacterium]